MFRAEPLAGLVQEAWREVGENELGRQAGLAQRVQHRPRGAAGPGADLQHAWRGTSFPHGLDHRLGGRPMQESRIVIARIDARQQLHRAAGEEGFACRDAAVEDAVQRGHAAVQQFEMRRQCRLGSGQGVLRFLPVAARLQRRRERTPCLAVLPHPAALAEQVERGGEQSGVDGLKP